MENFPVTTAGVAAWQVWLYAQATEAIAKEADDAEYDFKDWMKVRFALSSGQEAYLDGLDDGLTEHWGESVAFFIRHGLPIELVKPEESPEVRSSKLILSEEELKTLENEAKAKVGGQAFEGVLRFRITY